MPTASAVFSHFSVTNVVAVPVSIGKDMHIVHRRVQGSEGSRLSTIASPEGSRLRDAGSGGLNMRPGVPRAAIWWSPGCL